METVEDLQAILDDIEETLALNPTDQDALARKETTIAYMTFLEEKERQAGLGNEERAGNTPNSRAESPMATSDVNFDQMMTLFTIAATIRATSIPTKDTSEAETEAKRRCIQSLSNELLTLLQEVATMDAKSEFAYFLRCNGYTSLLDKIQQT